MTPEASSSQPVLLVGDLMQMSVELIQVMEEDRRNGNIVTVRVRQIFTGPDGIKSLYLERAEALRRD